MMSVEPYIRPGGTKRSWRVMSMRAAGQHARARRIRRKTRAVRAGQRGYVRTGGSYGRYAGPDAEHKFHDIDIDDAVVAAGVQVNPQALLIIPEGNGESQRIGRKITIKKIGWRFTLTLPTTATAANTSDTLRIMLIHDKQCNGALPIAGDILDVDTYRSFNNLANSSRFRVLMDRTYSLNSPSGSGRGTTDTLSYGDFQLNDSFFKNCNIDIQYDNTATSGVITSIRSNNIFAVYCSRGGLAAVNSTMRFRFSDQ